MTRWRLTCETLGVALIGVALFHLIHSPMPWMLGSLTSVMVWGLVTKRPLYWPYAFRQTALIMLGYLLGTSFTRDTVLKMAEYIPSMLFVTIMTILFSILLGYGFSKSTGVDISSSIIGSVPGGLTQMLVLSEEIKEVDPTVVAMMQMMRVMAVVFIVPFLTVSALPGAQASVGAVVEEAVSVTWAGMPWYTYILYPLLMLAGAWGASKINLPTAYLLGPLLVTAALLLTGFSAPPLPDDFVIVAQLLIGVHMGLQMKPTEVPNWKKVTLYMILTSVLLVVFSLGLAFILAKWHHLDLHAAFLGAAPGGMAEMGVTAAAIGADLSVVSSYQLFRLLTIMLIVPYILRWWMKRSKLLKVVEEQADDVGV